MFAIRARRKVASERDFLDAVEKVVRQGTKFSSTYVAKSLILRKYTDCHSHPDLYIKYIISLCVSVSCHIRCINNILNLAKRTKKAPG